MNESFADDVNKLKEEEYTLPDGLTLWDVHRPLRQVNADQNVKIRVSKQIISRDVQCPVCLSPLTNTLTAMECLHRFCQDCIEKSLRVAKKECPACRASLNSRRQLRPDEKLDRLISILLPNTLENEEAERIALERAIKAAQQRQEDMKNHFIRIPLSTPTPTPTPANETPPPPKKSKRSSRSSSTDEDKSIEQEHSKQKK